MKLTRNLFDRSVLCIAPIALFDKSKWQSVIAAKFVNDNTGILASILCDKSKLERKKNHFIDLKICGYFEKVFIPIHTIPIHYLKINHRLNHVYYYAINRQFSNQHLF